MKLLFVLLLCLFIVTYPFIRLWLAVRNSSRQRQTRNSGAYGRYNEPQTGQQGRVLSDVEEDAEFETVNVPHNQSTSAPTQVPREEQVTDAEFEEVK